MSTASHNKEFVPSSDTQPTSIDFIPQVLTPRSDCTYWYFELPERRVPVFFHFQGALLSDSDTLASSLATRYYRSVPASYGPMGSDSIGKLKDSIRSRIEVTIHEDPGVCWDTPTLDPATAVTRVSGFTDPDVSSLAFEVSYNAEVSERDLAPGSKTYTFLAYQEGGRWMCARS